ncbi:MAG: Holliday junction branch migration protein RuvA [Gammaproteobacteria bacterium]|nr:Holliday junction branch migration protein RuvA [Gammaproteobacteria bacterium]
MISFLRGILASKTAPEVVLDVNGVGYNVLTPMSTFYDLPETGQQVVLLTHLSIREDAHVLFGFLSDQERDLFRSLVRINGVGPKLALAILSGISINDFQRCVFENNVASLVKLPGIGKKTAERLIIEMRDRLPEMSDPHTASQDMPGPTPNQSSEAIRALIALGYGDAEARRMIGKVGDDSMNSETMIRLALQSVNG